MRTHKEIKNEVLELLRAFAKSGIPTQQLRKSIRFYVTPEEATMVRENMEDRATVSSSVSIRPGYYLGFFGVRFTTSEGEYIEHTR